MQPVVNIFKECLQTAVSQQPNGSDVKLPVSFQTEIVLLKNNSD